MKPYLLLLAGLCLCRPLLAQTPALQTEQAARLDAFFQKAERYGWSGSALVAHQGKILLEKGYGWQDREAKARQTAQTVFSIGSITKQFTGAAILKLEMQGKLHVSDPLSKFFPKAPADKAEITLHQLLTHTAGCPDALGDDYEAIDAQAFMQRFFDTPLTAKPGEAHRYSNVGYSILGIVIEKVSGEGYEKYLHDNLWQPASMERTGYLLPGHAPAQLAVGYRNGERWGTALDRPWPPGGPGWNLRANGGVLSTVGDMYRWFLALQADKMLGQAAKARYFGDHVRECPSCATHYGYGWVLEEPIDNQRFVWHNGGNGAYNAYMGFVLETGLCVVLSSNSNDKIMDDYLPKIWDALSGEGAPTVDAATVEKYTATFRLAGGAEVRVRFDELDRLRMEWDDAAALLALSGDGSETLEATEPFVARSLRLAEEARVGNTDALAKSMRMPPAEVAEQDRAFWQNQARLCGEVKRVEPIGAVLRPAHGATLVFVRVVGARKNRYLTYVWAGDELVDFRAADVMDKEFDLHSRTEFFAPNNQMHVLLQPDGNILLRNKAGRERLLLR